MCREKTVLVVVAHADDMEFLAGGTIARFVKEKGYDVYEYILTDNSKGSYSLPVQELIDRSAQEAVDAAEVLGLKGVWLEGCPDGRLNETPSNVIREKIMAKIREVKADIIMSWDPFAPCESHPDHRVVAMAAYEAAAFSGMPLFHPEHPWPPHPVTEAYWFAKYPWKSDTYVNINTTIELKVEALLKHQTQMELTIEGLRREAELMGVDATPFENTTPEGIRMVMDHGVRKFCKAKGAPAGMQYAEQFRYEKFLMLDGLLGMEVLDPDF